MRIKWSCYRCFDLDMPEEMKTKKKQQINKLIDLNVMKFEEDKKRKHTHRERDTERKSGYSKQNEMAHNMTMNVKLRQMIKNHFEMMEESISFVFDECFWLIRLICYDFY